MYGFLQKLGRSLMLPVAVLPAAAVMIGIANSVKALLGHENFFSEIFFKAGTGILDQIGLLFAIGVAIGIAKKNDGSLALASVIGFFTITTLLSIESVSQLTNVSKNNVNLGFSVINNSNVFIGIIIGLVAAFTYNKFSDTELPAFLSFFSGKRLVPILTAFFSIFIALVLLFIWPIVYSALITFGEWILNLGAIGAGLYGFFNRLLIPTGFHHVLNSVFWFDIAGVNDILNFQNGKGEEGITGRYMSGFFPIAMFGLPAAALAMYHTAKTQQKKEVASLMLAGVISSFVVGVTEPIEFTFMFAAPFLFFIHALLTGLSLFIAALFHWTSGFTFSAGLIDFLISLVNPIANKPFMLIVQGIFFFIIYYFIFRFVIKVLDLKTPGRDEKAIKSNEKYENDPDENIIADNKYSEMANNIILGLGEVCNIKEITNCATRLRIELEDNTQIDEVKIKKSGAVAVTKNGKHQAQVIIGTHVQQVADEIERQLYN
ncbi:N-acetylglucosamine-specific PTS transporter subunit IIBC [Staphylococcus succinus]|uniref:N-acetylglucosamine-specific PTS transporter subunit IIBC n=1 Tax=Staphylococcus succinus TaxID=61015 RepID=UPI001C03AFD1|nr:N-acetylglucosamine-specific PTS transporter subunit IIBC [Staphylococcus succinus]MBU0439335.1 N-acetylglucosamine-specific PTS transporter subunit IIBC [Staphylococcus succinus]